MAIGRKMQNKRQLKKAMAQKTGKGFQFVGKDGSRTVRFLTEPEGNWVEYESHYDKQARTSFPCIGEEEGCPGCESGMDRSTKWIANALDVDENRAIIIEMPKSLANKVYGYYDKYETLLDRDYELARDGEGLDTTYDAFPEDKAPRKLDKYDIVDLEGELEKSAEAYLGASEDDEDDDDEPRQPRKPKKSTKSPRRRQEEDDDDYEDDEEDGDEDEDDEPPRRKKAAPKRSKAAPKRRRPDPEEEEEDEEEDEEEEDDYEDDDIEEDDDEDVDEEEDDDDEYYTEEELEEMTVAQLRIVAKEYGIKVTGMKKPELVVAILGD